MTGENRSIRQVEPWQGDVPLATGLSLDGAARSFRFSQRNLGAQPCSVQIFRGSDDRLPWHSHTVEPLSEALGGVIYVLAQDRDPPP